MDITASRMEIDQCRLLVLKAAHAIDSNGTKAARKEVCVCVCACVCVRVVAPASCCRVTPSNRSGHTPTPPPQDPCPDLSGGLISWVDLHYVVECNVKCVLISGSSLYNSLEQGWPG